MATAQKTLFTDAAPSASGLADRYVEDHIRYLARSATVIMALIADGKAELGEVVRKKGMISKKPADQARVEGFTHSPVNYEKTVTAVDTLDISFASVADVNVRDVFKNTANDKVCIVDQISSLKCSMISLGTTFTASVGDVLIKLGNAYEYGSSDPTYVQQGDDNYYNVMQIFRFPVDIARSFRSTKQLAGGDYFKRMSKYNLIEGMQSVERSCIWGQKSNTTTVNVTALTTTGISVPHQEGLWNFAQNSFDFGNSMTPEKFQKDMVLSWDRSISYSRPLIALMSREGRARILDWQYDKLVYLKGGELEKFGIKSDTMITSGPDIHIVAHDAFDNGADTDKMLLFDTNQLQWSYKQGFDLHPNTNIQSPSKDGFTDEITGEGCIFPLCGGYNLVRCTNLF